MSARGLRGDYSPGRGDITGQRYLANSDEKIKREEAMKRTRNALVSDPCVVVGGYLVPKEAFNKIVAATEEQAAML